MEAPKPAAIRTIAPPCNGGKGADARRSIERIRREFRAAASTAFFDGQWTFLSGISVDSMLHHKSLSSQLVQFLDFRCRGPVPECGLRPWTDVSDEAV